MITDLEILQAMLDLVDGALKGTVRRSVGALALRAAVGLSLKLGVQLGVRAAR